MADSTPVASTSAAPLIGPGLKGYNEPGERRTQVMAGGKTTIIIGAKRRPAIRCACVGISMNFFKQPRPTFFAGDNRPTPMPEKKQKAKAWGQEFKGWGSSQCVAARSLPSAPFALTEESRPPSSPGPEVSRARARRPAAPEAQKQPDKSREERLAELQALMAEEEENMELARCTCFRLHCLRTRMFRAVVATLGVFLALLLVLSAGLIQQALEVPEGVGDDGFPHVTFLALSGWARLPRDDALRMAAQMGVAGDLLGARKGPRCLDPPAGAPSPLHCRHRCCNCRCCRCS